MDQWMEKIDSASICNYFYVFFVVYAFIFSLSLLGLVASLFNMKKMGNTGVFLALQAAITTALGGTTMLFFYIICDRALLAKPAAK